MDRQEIVNRVNRMDTKADLLSLLNDLKEDDLGNSAYPFTMKQINYYCNPNKNKRRYSQFEIPKKIRWHTSDYSSGENAQVLVVIYKRHFAGYV